MYIIPMHIIVNYRMHSIVKIVVVFSESGTNERDDGWHRVRIPRRRGANSFGITTQCFDASLWWRSDKSL